MLTPRLWGFALYCANQELRRRRGDKPPPRRPIQGWESELVRALELEVSTSAIGSAAPCGDEQSETVLISASQAAVILRCTTRYIGQIAEDRLGGVKVAGRWVFDEDVVREYRERQRNARIAG